MVIVGWGKCSVLEVILGNSEKPQLCKDLLSVYLISQRADAQR
jgi:hypothetical protein